MAYSKDYKHYAAVYAASERTVKRWVTDGRAKNEEPPLDDPSSMPTWWARVMSQKCPKKIISISGGVAMELPVAEKKQAAPSPEQKSEPKELRQIGDDEKGIEQALKRLQEQEVRAHDAFVEAQKRVPLDEGHLKITQSLWHESTKQLRTLEKTARQEAEAQRSLIPRNQAEQAAVELHTSIMNEFRGMGKIMAAKLGVPYGDKFEEAWNAEVDGMCEKLCEEVFS